MKYKLLVLDVDGTLLDSEKKISKIASFYDLNFTEWFIKNIGKCLNSDTPLSII